VSTDLERVGGRALSGGFEGATVTDVGLRFDADITTDRAEEIVGLLGRIDRSAKWWLGDWVIQYANLRGGGPSGEDAALHVGAEQTGYSETALSNWRDVTTLVPEELRDPRLDFTTYIELAKLLRAGLDVSVFTDTRDRLIQLREEWPGRNSGVPFPNHKVAREVVAGVLEAGGVEDQRLFHFPTTEEQIAEQSAEIMRLRTELEDTQLAAGTHVRCPRCSNVQSYDSARIVPQVAE
jgi:hypothetical protein